MIALWLVVVVGSDAQGTLSWRRTAIALLGCGVGFFIAAQVDAIFAFGAISGPYVAMLLVTGAVAAIDRAVRRPNAAPHTAGPLATRFGRHRPALIAAIVLAGLFEITLWAGVFEHLLGLDHTFASSTNRFGPAGFPHLLGTDQLSRDVFLRLCFCGRLSLAVGISAAALSALLGASIGLFAGFRGGVVDALLMRLTDAMLSIPILPLLLITSALDLGAVTFGQSLSLGAAVGVATAVVLVGLRMWTQDRRGLSLVFDGVVAGVFLGGVTVAMASALRSEWMAETQLASVLKITLLIALFGWMSIARLSRGAALELRQREFVVAARALGASEARVILQHILPSSAAPIVVAATLDVGANILYEAALSYLGLGVKPPVASWGNMLDHALVLLRTDPALAFWPGATILMTVACFNLVGDGLRDATDPHHALNPKAK